MDDIISFEYLHDLVKNKKIQSIRRLFNEHNIVDLSDLVDQLDMQDSMFVYRALNTEIAADLFAYLDSNRQEDLITAFTNQELNTIVENLYSDDVIELLDDLPANMQKKILQHASQERRAEINVLLNYKDYTAGSIMTTEYVEIKGSDTAQEALKKIKKQAREAETINYCFVIDDQRRLQGVVRLNEIVFTSAETKVEDIMDDHVITVNAHDDQEVAADTIKKYDINVLPVVNDQFRLIGIITVDDILDVIEEENTEDIQKMNAVTPLEHSYKKTTVLEMYQKRIVWLMVLMITATLTQILMSNFEEVLQASIMAIFIPMLMDTAGNAGGQSSSLIIRGLALNEITTRDYMLVLKKEISVAFLAGITLAIVNYIRILLIPTITPNNKEMFVLSLTLVITVVISKVIGGVLPILAKHLKQDPAVMAGPMITTIVDTITLVVYFFLASRILGLS